MFRPYEYVYTRQTQGIDVQMKSNITGFITVPDTDFQSIDTPNGKVDFVEFIGATDSELRAIYDGNITVKELYEKLGSDVTNYNREAVIQNSMDFPFGDASNTAIFTCCHVIENNEPILYVSHDEDDGTWQFLCGKKHEENEARIVSLHSIYLKDKSVGTLAEMPCGCCAERKDKNAEWFVSKRTIAHVNR